MSPEPHGPSDIEVIQIDRGGRDNQPHHPGRLLRLSYHKDLSVRIDANFAYGPSPDSRTPIFISMQGRYVGEVSTVYGALTEEEAEAMILMLQLAIQESKEYPAGAEN